MGRCRFTRELSSKLIREEKGHGQTVFIRGGNDNDDDGAQSQSCIVRQSQAAGRADWTRADKRLETAFYARFSRVWYLAGCHGYGWVTSNPVIVLARSGSERRYQLSRPHQSRPLRLTVELGDRRAREEYVTGEGGGSIQTRTQGSRLSCVYE